MFSFYNRTSIRHKIVFQLTSLVTLALLVYILAVLFLVREQVTDTTQTVLEYKAQVLQEKVEQRLGYLIENTTLLSSNQLMVNALTDSEGREKYLPSLIDNFIMGKDVVSLDVVDYSGGAIYQTQKDLPSYNESAELRSALAYRKTAYWLRADDHNIEVISPIEYYNTTQGAVVVTFDLNAIVGRNLAADDMSYVRLFGEGVEFYQSNYSHEQHYYAYTHRVEDKDSLFSQLGIELELGLPRSVYNAPLIRSVLPLLALGVLFLAGSVLFAMRAGNRIAEPVLELNRRVKASNEHREVFCSPIGTGDELEDLAKAFDDRTLALQYQAEHDALTELPNRVLFLDRLRQAIKSADRSRLKLAVLFIDLDRFKEVNDSFGHDTGDALLQVVADEIIRILRASDSIARLGGDEFALLLNQIEHEEVIISVLEKVLRIFREPFTIHNRQLYVTCSVGVAIYPDNGSSSEELLRNADSAMYKAKDEGRYNYQFYTADMTRIAYERVTLETRLRDAIRNQEFLLHYQPQMDMRSNRLLGMECLVRWQDDEKGMVPPNQFIGLAEETGLIVQIDRWVLKEALRQYQLWRQEGLDAGVISVNLSAVQLNQQDFIDFVQKTVDRYGIEPSQLMFEVTETAIMRSPERANETLNRIKKLGFGLALDDFGTGLSSLSYLKKLPIDKIKIDQSFVRDIPVDKEDMRLVQAIVRMANSLNLELIAEGVETEEQSRFLVANECYEAQGYYYYKPCDAGQIQQILLDTKEKALPRADQQA